MTTPPAVDVQKLAAMIRTKRAGRGLRLVAKEIGEVSASTLSRLEQGNVPDLETFMRLCHWLGVSADDFRPNQQPTKSMGSTPIPEVIEAHLRADRTLPSEAIDALSQMIRFAYKAAEGGQFRKEK
jgi:transcriptional regulator with XRE-family HTH domain